MASITQPMWNGFASPLRGWAFVYEGNAAGVGGPERLVIATPFSVGE